MRKIPCLFERVFRTSRDFDLTDRVTPGCEWVVTGEGRATVKWDGTACLVKDGVLWKRYDAKVNPRTGVRKSPPEGAVPCEPEPDPVTGHWPHWVRVDPARPEDRWHATVLDVAVNLDDGTYELCGPAVGGNSHGFTRHYLVRHGAREVLGVERTLEGIRRALSDLRAEGIVFHHPDGRMVKIRRADFGLPWPADQSGR